jgi:hypothetical protein
MKRRSPSQSPVRGYDVAERVEAVGESMAPFRLVTRCSAPAASPSPSAQALERTGSSPSRRPQLVSYLRARWTLSSTASGQDVPGQKSDDDDRRRDCDDGDGGGGYDHAPILASGPAPKPGGDRRPTR